MERRRQYEDLFVPYGRDGPKQHLRKKMASSSSKPRGLLKW